MPERASTSGQICEQRSNDLACLASSPKASMEYSKNIGIWGFVTRLCCDNAQLIDESRYFDGLVMESLRTNVYKIDRLPDGTPHDAEMTIHDRPGLTTRVNIRPGCVEAQGDFSEMERTCPDSRYSLFGNLGLYFRFAMAEMEGKGLFSFHASALYREEDRRLVLLIGPPGSGKTVFLMGGVPLGYKVLSAEMTHVRLDERGVHFYKGALFDNIRIGNFTVDFPQAIDMFGVKIPQVEDLWAKKIAVDMQKVATREDVISNPTVVAVFPKVEAGRGAPQISVIKHPQITARMLFNNLSEKICGSFLLYDRYPVASLDSPQQAARRGEFVQRLLPHVAEAKNVLTGPKECMKGV